MLLDHDLFLHQMFQGCLKCKKLGLCTSAYWCKLVVAGRSNVGKSSLINALTRQWGVVRTSDKPGLTQVILHWCLCVCSHCGVWLFMVAVTMTALKQIVLMLWSDVTGIRVMHLRMVRRLYPVKCVCCSQVVSQDWLRLFHRGPTFEVNTFA